ncbi:MAG: sigma-70 family RNA polymerase sigma factor, partial [Phycisphaerae bacterium]
MQSSWPMFSSPPASMQSVALLPMNWRTLGAAMLEFITRRAQLPTVAENLRRRQLVHFVPARFTTPIDDTKANNGEHIENLYQAWCNAANSTDRRTQLGELTRAFTPLIRAAIRQYHVVHLADAADLEQEAFLGLHAALQTYDPRRGVALAGFVRWRIVGAVLDARRKWLRQGRGYPSECLTHSHTANAAMCPPTQTDTDAVEFEDLFTVLTRGLSSREKLILRLSILEEKTCRQIGQLIGLHHARV